jgi:quinol monooxygenase YgiN
MTEDEINLVASLAATTHGSWNTVRGLYPLSTVSQGAAVAITAILDLQLKADSLETAHKVLHATLSDTRAFLGCLDVTVLVDSDDPTHVVLYETWESIEHDRAYRAWRASPEGTSDLGSILAAAPKLSRFTVAEGV